MPGTPTLDPNTALVNAEKERMAQAPYGLDQARREVVLQAIQEVCTHRNWDLLAAHVRTNHVHVVVGAEVPPEKVMGDFKAYASRRLNAMQIDQPDRKRWARHGGTRWLAKPENVSAAIEYVVVEQGDAMSVFEADEL